MKMQSKKQSGFTLIELMIVVTIIGVLASIAVPAYRDYTVRTRVGECASIFSPIKTEFSIYYSETSNTPGAGGLAELASNSLGRISDTPASYVGDYVEQVNLANDVASCTLRDITPLGDAAAGIVDFTASAAGNTVNWTVSGNGVDERFLPTNL